MDGIGVWRQVWRDAGGELAVAVAYLLAWLFCAWLPDAVVLGLMVGTALQFFVVTMVLGAITPRGFAGIAACVIGHGLLFALMAWIASADGRQAPDWLAVGLAQAPLLLRTLARRARPAYEPRFMLLEAIGPFFLLMPVLLLTAALLAVLPDTGLAPRTLTFRHFAPLDGEDIGFGLLGGAVYFALYGIARTAMERLGGDMHRRADLDLATIRKWREDYLRSRGGK